MRGQSLLELIDMFKAEAGLALGANSGKDQIPVIKKLLSRTQQDLYDDYDWPFLRIWSSKTISAGQRYYDTPTDINLERIEQVRLKWDGTWDRSFTQGIGFDEYSLHDSSLDERSDPPRHWDIRRTTASTEQIEIWPIPVTSGGSMSFQGLKKLRPLVDDDDTADLDDRLIVLFSASEYLDGRKEGLGQRKLAQAQQLYASLKARLAQNEPERRLGSGPSHQTRTDFRGVKIQVR